MSNDFWISFVVASLAVYRLSRMFAIEEGPFEMFVNARGYIWEHFKQDWVRNGIACPLCISFYVGLVAAILVTWQNHLDWYAVIWLWFALSGAASFLYVLERR